MNKLKLKVGDIAPDFCLLNQDEKDICLKDFKGKNVILYFYPKDNTPGCSLQAMIFTKYKPDYEKLNTTILGVSKDSCNSHKKFMGRKFLGTIRTTFLIDSNGKIRKIWDNVKIKGHVEEVLEKVKNLK